MTSSTTTSGVIGADGFERLEAVAGLATDHPSRSGTRDELDDRRLVIDDEHPGWLRLSMPAVCHLAGQAILRGGGARRSGAVAERSAHA